MDLYPDINDHNFQFLIAQKLEFRALDNPDMLYSHQEFVRRFMSPYTPYTSLILFHNLGSGKSIACIAVAVDHYLYDGKQCIIVTKGQSGTDTFLNQIRLYRKNSSRTSEWDESIFRMRHYMSLSNQIREMTDEAVSSSYSNSVIVLDEVHNIRYLMKHDKSVYNSIVRMLILCTNVRLIMATATPMTDNSEQLRSLLGICNCMTMRENDNMNGIISYNPFIRDKPESSYIGNNSMIPGLPVWPSDMVGHQRYTYLEEQKKGVPKDIYRSLTHVSLFCFPNGVYGRNITSKMMTKTSHVNVITPMSTNRTREVRYVKYNIKPEFSNMLHGEGLRASSSKYNALLGLVQGSEGNAFVFVEEVRGSGLLLLASVLEAHGYELYIGEDLSRIQPGRPRYTMCVGSVDLCPNVLERLDGFNSSMNKHGEYVKVLLGSKVIGESITLLNVRQFHCITPHWNDSTINQAVGRVVRNGSHNALDPDDRRVDIYVHAAVLPGTESIDIRKLRICHEKQNSIQQKERDMIEQAVDRYCIVRPHDVPVTSFETFAACYIHNYIDAVIASITGIGAHSTDVDELSSMLRIDPVVCREAVCCIIRQNRPLNYPDRGPLYLRAYNNTIFTVRDPSMPYVTLPKVTRGIEPRSVIVSLPSFPADRVTTVRHFRYMPVKQKIHFLEQSILQYRDDILQHIPTVFAQIDSSIYHLLWYRDLESSYTSSNPVPRKPIGRARRFDGKTWATLNRDEELSVFPEYRRLVDSLMTEADSHPGVFGIISSIDGGMRLRLRVAEDFSMSVTDSRYVKRGKSIKSIKKRDLLTILKLLDPKIEVVEHASINDIICFIDDRIVRMATYAII